MKNSILLLLVLIGFSVTAQESLDARLAKVPKPEEPESIIKWAIDAQDFELLKYGVDKAGASIKKLTYSYNNFNLNKGSMFLGVTPLIQASALGNLEMVNYLIEKKVDVDATCKAPIYQSEAGPHNGKAKGITAIHLAAQKGYKEVVQALIDGGADIMSTYLEVDASPGNRSISSTPKQWAGVHGQTEVEELLKSSKKGAFKSMMANPMGKKKK